MQYISWFLFFMIFNNFDIWHIFLYIGSVYCTSDISNPTPVYVVEGGDAVLQCGFDSNGLSWYAHNDVLITSGDDITDKSKYNVSTKPSTGLYYRLHILNVGVSDLTNYKCSGSVNGLIQTFYLQLYIIGMCNYILVIFKVGTSFISVGRSKFMCLC